MKKTLLLCALFALSQTFTNCSSDDDQAAADTNAPNISMQSPDLNQTFATEMGFGLGPEIALLSAQAVDDTKMASLKLTVTNEDGTIIFEETHVATAQTGTTMTISEGFETTNAGIYNVVFTAEDASGNVSSSSPRVFTYED